MCIIHKGFRGNRELSPASIFAGNMTGLKSEIPYEIIHSTLCTSKTNSAIDETFEYFNISSIRHIFITKNNDTTRDIFKQVKAT